MIDNYYLDYCRILFGKYNLAKEIITNEANYVLHKEYDDLINEITKCIEKFDYKRSSNNLLYDMLTAACGKTKKFECYAKLAEIKNMLDQGKFKPTYDKRINNLLTELKNKKDCTTGIGEDTIKKLLKSDTAMSKFTLIEHKKYCFIITTVIYCFIPVPDETLRNLYKSRHMHISEINGFYQMIQNECLQNCYSTTESISEYDEMEYNKEAYDFVCKSFPNILKELSQSRLNVSDFLSDIISKSFDKYRCFKGENALSCKEIVTNDFFANALIRKITRQYSKEEETKYE